MHSPSVPALAAVLLSYTCFCAALPADAQTSADSGVLQKRAAGTMSDPHILTISCRGTEDVNEARCWGYLCGGNPNPYEVVRSDKDHSKQSRYESGALTVFKGTDQQLANRGVERLPNHPDWTSAEDTVRASAQQGGWGTWVVPVDPDHNRLEGSRYEGQLSHNNVHSHEYVKEYFVDLSPGMKYCHAYQSTPPDYSVCKDAEKKQDPNDIQMHAYRKTKQKKGNAYQYHKFQIGDSFGSFAQNGYKRDAQSATSDVVEKRDAPKYSYKEEAFDNQSQLDKALKEGESEQPSADI